jgi:hypothetical protein
MAMIISEKGKKSAKVQPSKIEDEDYLQRYISENPDTIPLYEIDEDIRLLILAREFPTPSGPIDALGIDREGRLYIIETKLYKNPDKRLVVAQALDYGASLRRFSGDFDSFVRRVDEATQKQQKMVLNLRLKDFFALGDDDISLLLESLKQNLNRGNFCFVVLMDRLDERLRDLIVFLNQNCRFDFYAVEVEHYRYQTFEIMIPRLFGAEVPKETSGVGSVSARSRWDEVKFFEVAKALSKTEAAAVRNLYEFSKAVGARVTWGTGAQTGSFGAKFDGISAKSIYTVYTDGSIGLNFGWLNDGQQAEICRDRLKQELEKTCGFSFPEHHRDLHPQLRAQQWVPVAKEFQETIAKVVKQGLGLPQP